MTANTVRSRLDGIQTAALITGGAGVALCILGALADTRQFFISYLFGYLFWLGLALGCLVLLMIHHLTGGRWGFPLRRFFEAAIMTLPLMALLFLPLFFGLRDLYPWSRPAVVAASEILRQKHFYMNAPAFMARAAVFFALLVWLARTLNKWSFLQDETTDPAPTMRLRTLSGPAVAIYPFVATFAYVDWILSLEADWYSTMFVILIIIGQILTALAFCIVLLAWLAGEEPYTRVVTITNFHHLGSLLLAFVMLWAYMAFGQFLIIWSGNLPAEIGWYIHRIAGGWKWLLIFLAIFHFFLPFFLLLSRDLKRRIAALAAVACIVFFAHLADVFWLVSPSFYNTGFAIHWMDAAAPVAVGGLWIAAFTARLKSRPLLVKNDPRQKDLPPDEH
jgi:hypothetical protein